ncbi:linoleate diol synthase [Coniochaeta sp. 2T2.1]|nr:linoleate diol synthase [Coniochaeta sp. 2T2.1]
MESPTTKVHSPGTNVKPAPANRPGIEEAFRSFGQLVVASRRPLPTQNGDGTYNTAKHQTGLREDLKVIKLRDLRTLIEVIKAKLGGDGITDDKTMIMERTIQLVSKLPNGSKNRVKLTDNLIAELWNSLDHPPLIYVGEANIYRKADGSFNNPMFPQLGAAGGTYARSVRPTIAPLGALPDPSLIFDSVMKRTEYKKHPNNVSSVLWYWATIVIHDLFWTDYPDMSKSKTSSYLDLSPLYGSNQKMQDSIRTFKDGKLKVDSYADKRLVGIPPGVSVILIMFNRFHNHVADNLAAINEGGRFTPPSDRLDDEKKAAGWKKYDEDLFQTARLVTSGLYINITLNDYVRNIINLNRCDTQWTLDPRQPSGVDVGTKKGAESGTGNVVSAEFNLCYRWHSCISARDDKWVQDFYQGIFNKPAEQISTPELVMGFSKFERSVPDDPADRTFGGFQRGSNGKFDDDDLVECITSSIEDVAGAFGARNVPASMRAIEVLGILQGRKWNVAGLNEFRKHFGLRPYEKFEDINSDPEVADQLRHLYGHTDFVELYPGIVAEEAKKPMVPGVGIAPTYTISRVVLSDAVVLVRGDRHYTIDYNPRSLTNWGFNEVQYDLNVNHGCTFYKLFLRAFPNQFKGNSVFAHYPMVVPEENRKILTDLKRVHLFDFSRPKFTAPRVNITSYGGAKHVLEDQEKYKSIWGGGFSYLMGDGGSKFMLSGDTAFHAGQRKCMAALLYRDGWKSHIKTFYQQISEQLLVEKSYKLAGQTHVDIIRDVGNIAHVHFAARMFNLPLKTRENPKGIYSEQELYTVLALIFVAIFFDIDPAKSFPLRQAAKTVAQQLGKLVETNVKMVTGFGLKGLFTSSPSSDDPLASYGVNLVKGLSKTGLSAADIAWSQILPTAGAMVPNQAEVFAQAVDFYLSPKGEEHLPELHRIAKLPSSEETDALLLGYASEGIRLAGTFGSYREAAVADTIVEDDGREVSVEPKDRIFVSFVSAARDPVHFPDPETINPRRPLESYIHYGAGPHTCLGREASQVALAEMFRALFRRRNVRRVPGPQGKLKKVPRPGGFFVYLREDWGSLWPFPVTMRVMWDED